MKALPILALTNAAALGLVIVLYVQQEDLKSQIVSARSTPGGRSATLADGQLEDRAELAARLERIERRLANRESSEGSAAVEKSGANAPEARVGGEASPEPGHASAAPESGAPASTADASGEFDPQEMEIFRKKVTVANEINAKEERVRRVVDDIDRLVAENKIGTLNEKQKKVVANVILGAREKMPGLWRKVNASVEGQNLPREQMGQLIRAEYETLRTETLTALEETMPAVDAKTLVDESMRERGGFMFGGRDGGVGVAAPPVRGTRGGPGGGAGR